MKKIATIGMLLYIILGIVACGADRERRFIVTEISAYNFAEPPSQFVLIDSKPCVLVAGEAYIYEEGSWNEIYAGKRFTEIYAGETFCALTEGGEIYATEDTWAEYKSYPLGSAGAYYNAEKMLQYSIGTKIRQISGNILNDYIIADFESGEVKVYVNGQEQVMEEPIPVVDMSGKYMLSEEGEVYVVSYPDSFERVKVRKVADGKFVEISACSTANQCIGVKQDGRVVVWSDVEGELASDFRDIERVSMGFNYCVGLSVKGEVYFASYDEELEAEMRDYLKTLEGKAIDITSAYNRVAIMFDDYSVYTMDL